MRPFFTSPTYAPSVFQARTRQGGKDRTDCEAAFHAINLKASVSASGINRGNAQWQRKSGLVEENCCL